MSSCLVEHSILQAHQTENPQGFSGVVENKQLLIVIVGQRFFRIRKIFLLLRLKDYQQLRFQYSNFRLLLFLSFFLSIR